MAEVYNALAGTPVPVSSNALAGDAPAYTSIRDLEKYANELGDAMKRLQVIDTKYEDISEQLLDAEVVKSRQSANATQSVAMQWLLGHKIDKTKSQY